MGHVTTTTTLPVAILETLRRYQKFFYSFLARTYTGKVTKAIVTIVNSFGAAG